MPQLVWTAQPDGQLNYANGRCYAYTGHSPEASQEWGWKAVLHPDDAARTISGWKQAVDESRPYEVHHRLRRHDGVYRWFLTRAEPMHDERGQHMGWIGTCTDVTDLPDVRVGKMDHPQERAPEAALRQSEEHVHPTSEELKLIIEVTGLGLWWNDLPLGKLRWNRHVKEHFWLSPDAEVDIDQFYEMLHPGDREMCRQAVEKAIGKRELFDVVYRTLGPKGEGQYKWIHARGRAYYGADGQPTRFVGFTQDITEDVAAHKRTEDALRESIERFQLATEAMSGLLYDWDIATGTVRRSQGFFQLTGYHPDEVPASVDWWNTRIHPDDMAEALRVYREALAARVTVVDTEYRVRHKRGHYFWVWDRSRVVYDSAGKPVRIVGCTVSIDDRKRAEQALALERERLSLAQRAGRVGLFEWDIPGDRLYWTPELEELFGLPPGGFPGTFGAFRAFVLPEDMVQLEASLAHWYAARQADVVTEYRFRPAGSDEIRWIRFRANIDYDDAGQPLRMLGTAVDVTEAKRDEEALRASEAQFRQLAEAMPQIVWTARPDGTVDYLNRKWYELTGLPEGLMGDASWLPIVHPDDRPRSADTWYESVRTGIPYEIEYRFRFAGDSDYRWHLGRALPVRDTSGAIVRWCGTCTDIHDQKRAQTELQEADRRKDEFLAMLAHELRNPLGPIRNSVHILRLIGSHGPQVVQARDMIDRQVTHMVHLIDDLLDVSRIARGKIQLRTERCDLAQIVRQTAEDYRTTLASSSLSLEVAVPAGTVWIHGDPTRLAQIVSNVLHNASKFTDPGGCVTVTMELEPEGMQAAIHIQDTGIGMDAEILARVFEPFSQADRSLERSKGGLGLGLALVKGLVELHGGTLSAHSRGPGTGSTFTLRLPVESEPAVEAAPARVAMDAHVPLSILIIEDNKDLADSLSMLLTVLGHKTEITYDGVSGLAAARVLRPDVVLCDIGLPEMDGFAVARAIRADPATQGAYLIAQTGYGQGEDQRRSQKAGFDRHMTKPTDSAELQRILAAVGASLAQKRS